MSMKITLKQLRVFDAIARLGNVSRAAEQIALSQSAASMSLADLEQHLGSPLFNRHGKKLQLNDYGRWLHPKVHQLLQQAENIELSAHSGELHGHLIVGASSTIGNYLLAAMVAEFVKLHPDIHIQLRVANSEQIVDDMINLRIDLGLIEGICHSHQLIAQPWRSDELITFCSPSHPLAQLDSVSLAELEQQQWILRESGSGTREIFTLATQHKLKHLMVALELGNSMAIKQAVKTGLGLGCMSRLTLASELRHGELVALPTPELQIERQFYLLTGKHQHQSELSLSLQHFIA
ncbi:DNA-binding transcriptional LysR family regulator [Sinobacterium caligoides]|uniref:DNA-binding transcriptional LysR family regulator n=1 Tax=Sinobacterium caligoides TaxID=933926 RepID=A0A3N2E104_9GAMM|nr:LysR family transcriptional regulator [Sinobacterium caligoides]ROS05791.1 DNA-binding transcriptional LysR family regulator [Sinobacterium caligoides]